MRMSGLTKLFIGLPWLPDRRTFGGACSQEKTGPPGGGASRDLWEPSSYDDEETVLSECSSSVRNFLAQRLLEKGGFLGKHAV